MWRKFFFFTWCVIESIYFSSRQQSSFKNVFTFLFMKDLPNCGNCLCQRVMNGFLKLGWGFYATLSMDSNLLPWSISTKYIHCKFLIVTAVIISRELNLCIYYIIYFVRSRSAISKYIYYSSLWGYQRFPNWKCNTQFEWFLLLLLKSLSQHSGVLIIIVEISN